MRLAIPLVAALGCAGCDATPQPAGGNDASASPNASILPAPLATEPPELQDGSTDDGSARTAPSEPGPRSPYDASTPPESMQPATPLPPEPVPYQRDVAGVILDAAFRWRDLAPPPRAPEVSADGLREAQKLTTLTLKIDLAESGRMRAELTGNGFALPARTELRGRVDQYGTLLVWPNAGGYRVIPPGALRAVIGERRVDVTPLSAGVLRAQGDGRRLGHPVRKVEIVSSVATIRLELGKVPEGGDGGPVLCRALVELGGVDPRTPACQSGEIPLAASYAWQEGGGISFEVATVTKRADLPASALLVPSPSLPYLSSGLPAVARGILLSREALAAFRTTPIVLPAPRDRQVPGEGFVAANHSDRMMFLVLDGIPTVWVPAFGEQYVIGPQRGRYMAQWRSFLGEKVAPPQPIEVPARLVFGGPVDAGAPDGG